MKKIPAAIISILIFSFLLSCCKKEIQNDNSAVIGISADIESLNPLYSFSVNEGNITELLFLSLVEHNWNNKIGDMEASPMLAKKWEWANDSSYIVFELRDDVKWSDDVSTTIQDVIFSFDVYSDPVVESRLFDTFKNFYTDKDEHINLNKTFEVLSPDKLKINFKPNSVPDLFDLDFPIIPKHIYEKIERKNIQTASENFNPVSNGPFSLLKWERNQSIILIPNKTSFLYNPESIKELIFKIIPDYTSRINQLKNGEIDMTEDVKTDDITDLKNNGNLEVVPIKGREYDYIGWNNIDLEAFHKYNRFIPNKLFGEKNVRIALTMAINRKEILEEFLGNYGEIAFSPITPIFKNAVNTKIKPYDYDINKARELLAQSGWKDNDNDGILEKGNIKFSFRLFIPSGNPRREYASTILKNNLKQISIDVVIEKAELGVFIENLYQKKYDAWMAGWSVPIPVELKSYWYSDLEKTPLNFAGYQSKEADELITAIEKEKSKSKRNELYKKFQEKIHLDEPVTFMYWIDNPVAYNKRIQNININPLGFVRHCWNWLIKE